jgi:hypothetical protein
MSDASDIAKSLRDRLSGTTEERLGKVLGELLENPLLTGAIGRAFDAREKASQAQEVAMGALNLPSAADVERLTRRLRSVSQRLEGIEDGVGRLDRAISPGAVDSTEILRRLAAIEAQLATLIVRVDQAQTAQPAVAKAPAVKARSASPTAARTKPAKRRAAARKPR